MYELEGNTDRVFYLVGLSCDSFIVGQIDLRVVSCKLIKHEKLCLENQHMFIAFFIGADLFTIYFNHTQQLLF